MLILTTCPNKTTNTKTKKKSILIHEEKRKGQLHTLVYPMIPQFCQGIKAKSLKLPSATKHGCTCKVKHVVCPINGSACGDMADTAVIQLVCERQACIV